MKTTRTVVTLKLDVELALDTDQPVNFLPVGDVLARLFTNRPEIVSRIEDAVAEGCGSRPSTRGDLAINLKRISQRKRSVEVKT